MTSDIVAFIRARLEEDEDRAHDVHRTEQGGRSAVYCDNVLAYGHDRCTCGYPDRVLREVAAKRAVVGRYEAMAAGVAAAEGTLLAGASRVRLGAYLLVLQELAAVWSDHPDFDPAWRMD